MNPRFFAQCKLRVRAGDRAIGVNAISGFEPLYIGSNGFHHTSRIHSRRVRQTRLAGVRAGTDIGIDRIHTGCFDAHEQLS